jgi:hypothetical protein
MAARDYENILKVIADYTYFPDTNSICAHSVFSRVLRAC